MNNQLNIYATIAWTAYEAQDCSSLERYSGDVYNYFVHNPSEILKLDNPLLIGKIFQVSLDFYEPDEDIQEVRSENAFICFSQALKTGKANIHDEAAARLMLLLIRDQKHLINMVAQSCLNEHYNPYNIFSTIHNGLPNDMPMATNTKMLYTAYYLYDGIIDKENVINGFTNTKEKSAYDYVKNHVIDNCLMSCNTSSDRKIELGQMVFEKICEKLHKEIMLYSDYSKRH